MGKYIPLDALLAWAKKTYLCENASAIRKVCYKQLVEHINVLEVKEVDFEKIWKEYFKYRGDVATVNIKHLAKHFFELGIKVQKEERTR